MRRSAHGASRAWRRSEPLSALFAIGLALREPDALTLPGPVHLAIGWSFVAAGAIAWRERPENRMGVLMTLTGIAWFGRDLDWFDSALAEHASELSLNLFLALVAHQLVVFPEGTSALAARTRSLVLAIYALAVLGYVPSEVSDAANDIFSALGIVLAVLVVFVIVRRWLEADGTERRAMRPLSSSGRRCMVVAAASLAHDYIGIDLSATGEEALRWCAVVYAGLPIAFLLGVLRTHIRRAILGRLLADLGPRRRVRRRRARGGRGRPHGRAAQRATAPPPRAATPRELEVLALIAEGRTDRGIAKELYVTPKTVEAHVRSIFRKLDLPREETENRRVHAVLTFLGARTP